MRESDEQSALLNAVDAGLRAAEFGFDWEHALDALDKVNEEARELREAIENRTPDEVAEELGDLYFAVCNVARKLALDPDVVLAAATRKFEYRFSQVLDAVSAQGADPRELSLEELEAIWVEVKARKQ